MVQAHNDAVFTGFTSAGDCADQCQTFGNWSCNSFEFCAASKTCTLSKIHTAEGTQVGSTQSCDLYDSKLYVLFVNCIILPTNMHSPQCYVSKLKKNSLTIKSQTGTQPRLYFHVIMYDHYYIKNECCFNH